MKKYYIRKTIILLMVLFIFTACKNKENSNVDNSDINNIDNTSQNSDNDDGNVDSNNDQTYKFEVSEEEQRLYDSLFNLESDVRVYIDIDDKELANIQKDYDKYSKKDAKSPIYRKCNLIIEINGEKHTIDEVGVRMKGNTSRRSFYDEKTGVYNFIHFKFSFDETFDDEEYYGKDAKVWDSDEERQARKKRKFASLNGLEMKYNYNTDTTYLRETYAFRMYRDFDVLAPMNNIGQCKVNDKNWGIFRIYEPVDNQFIMRNFEEASWGGDLYKCTWGNGPASYDTVNGRAGADDADKGEYYTYDLKTNKKTSKHQALSNMVKTISSKNLKLDELEKVVDTKNWVTFSAVSYMLGMPDDLRNNYNNHYVYFKKDTNQAVFIAYDCDIAMGIKSWNPTGDFMVNTDPFSEQAYGEGNINRNPLVLKTLTNDGLLKNEYTQALKDVVNSKWLEFNTFENMYNDIYAKYNDVSIPDFDTERLMAKQFEMSINDTYKNGQVSGNMPVQEYMTKMISNCKKYIE